MNERFRLAGLVAVMTFGMTATSWAQERPARDRAQPPPPAARPAPREPAPPAPAAPTREAAPSAAPPVVARVALPEARLVPTSIELVPAQPIAGQEIQVAIVVENQSTAPSAEGSRFIVRCTEVPREPPCPESAFEAVLTGIAPGQRQRAMIPLGAAWNAGRYRLLVGPDAGEARPHELDLVVQSPPVVAARVEPRGAARGPEGGAARELKPQPEPPSAEAARAVAEPQSLADAARQRDASAPARQMAPPPAMAAPPAMVAPPPPPDGEPAAGEPAAETLAAFPQGPPIPQQAPSGEAAAPPGGMLPIGLSADLAFGLWDGVAQNWSAKSGTQVDVYKPSFMTTHLVWSSPYAEQFVWLWQVTSQPFPVGWSAPPPGLLAEKAVPTSVPEGFPSTTFVIDLGSFPPLGQSPTPVPKLDGAQALAGIPPTGGQGEALAPIPQPEISQKPPSGELPPAFDENEQETPAQAVTADPNAFPEVPIDFYIRLIPTKNGQPAGPPSNTVIAHYVPGPNPSDEAIVEAFQIAEEKKKQLAEMEEKAKIYEVAIVSFQPMIFEDPNKWGCIEVVKNDHYGEVFHPLAGFKPGEEYCPPNNPEYMEKDWDEKALQVLEAYKKTYEIMSAWWEGVKDDFASEFADFICDESADQCKMFVKGAVKIGIDVGLGQAGVPSTLPDIKGLDDLAKGKIVDFGVDYTCAEIESKGYGTCTPEMRAGLAKLYGEGLDRLEDELAKQASEPDCGDAKTADEHGKLPLPCFSAYPGTEVKPIAGAVQEAAGVTVQVNRTKPDPDFPLPDCQVRVRLSLENNFSGGYVMGVNLPAAKITPHQALESGGSPIPPLAVGESATLTVALDKRSAFHLPGLQGGTGYDYTEWLYLYKGGWGPLTASVYSQDAALACSEEAKLNVQIPK